MMISIQQRVDEAVAAVLEAWKETSDDTTKVPEVIITTGSGLGVLVDRISPIILEMSYDDIPHLPSSGMPGHAGRLIIGNFGGSSGKKVIVLDGRVHGYEGHSALTQVLPFLIANQLCNDAKLTIFTNAAGAINESYQVGQLAIIKDHINFMGATLVAFEDESLFGGKNLDMTFAYSPYYREILKETAGAQGIDIVEGVYIGLKGAMFETPAEIRAFRIWGADLVGMSTVHEVVAASRLGIDAVAISVITNMAAGIEARKLTLEEVIVNTAKAAQSLSNLISGFLDQVQ